MRLTHLTSTRRLPKISITGAGARRILHRNPVSSYRLRNFNNGRLKAPSREGAAGPGIDIHPRNSHSVLDELRKQRAAGLQSKLIKLAEAHEAFKSLLRQSEHTFSGSCNHLSAVLRARQ